jgi:hypothetical protein
MAALLMIPLTTISGGAVDLMLHERLRSSFQNDLDRGVLAAASLTQTIPARKTIEDYLNNAGHSGYSLTIDEGTAVNKRVVSATAEFPMETTFLYLVGIRSIDVVAHSKAEEAKRNIEISMVLDVSGSMTGSRMNALRPAAKSFINRLLRDETKDYTSMNLIPFAGQVSVGEKAFDALVQGATKPVRQHDKSSCFGNLDTKFSEAIPDFEVAEHVPQFSTWVVGTNKGFDPWSCPTEETSVTFMSNDRDALSEQVDGFHMFDGTGTHIAMKWALHGLDPKFRDTLKTIQKNSTIKINSTFANRPANYHDSDTLKLIVLMTDGEVVPQFRPNTGKAVNDQPQNANEKNKTIEQKVSSTVAIDRMTDACDAAKGHGIVIYAVGFEVSGGNFLSKLKGCASSPSHYYDAKSSNLNAVFQNIASSIEQLHLTN